MEASPVEVRTGDCPLAGLRFEQSGGCKPLHPVEILARAYRPDGFPHPVGEFDSRRPIDASGTRNIAEYESERSSRRPQIIALEERRRIRVGGHMTFLLENRETVRYEIRRMMRMERIVEP